MNINETANNILTVTPPDATISDLVVTSSDTTVATVLVDSENPLKFNIVGVGGGTTTIEAELDDLTDTFTVTVINIQTTDLTSESSSLSTIEAPLINAEVYGNTIQDETPTPDNEVSLKEVTGNNPVYANGKYYAMKQGGITTGGVINSANTKRLYSDSFEITNYESITISSNKFTYRCRGLYFYNENDEFVSSAVTETGYTFPHTFSEIPENAKSFRVVFQNYPNTQDITPNGKYLVFEQTLVTLPLGNEKLFKIGSYKDRIYYDDEAEKWFKEEKISKTILDGTEQWAGVGYELTNSFRFYTGTILEQSVNGECLSNYFKNDTVTNINTIDSPAMTIINSRQIILRIDKTLATTTAELKTWLGTHNTEVYHVLETPITTEITDTDLLTALNQLKALNMYEGQTNFEITPDTGNANLILHLTYYKKGS